MNLNTQFPSEKEKKEAINMLNGLIASEGWQFFRDIILKSEIQEIENDVWGIIDDIETEKRLKMKRNLLVILTQLPEKLIDALKANEPSVSDYDPYPRVKG